MSKMSYVADCRFKKAVEATLDVANGFCSGLQAIEKVDKSAVNVKDAHKVDGSLNIDK